MDLIHLDILGLFKIGLDGSWYIITFLYNITQLLVTYCIKSKANIFNCFKNFKQYYKWLNYKIHWLQANNSGEYMSKAILKYLFLSGITPEFTVPGNP
jgi:hypothetical protein